MLSSLSLLGRKDKKKRHVDRKERCSEELSNTYTLFRSPKNIKFRKDGRDTADVITIIFIVGTYPPNETGRKTWKKCTI